MREKMYVIYNQKYHLPRDHSYVIYDRFLLLGFLFLFQIRVSAQLYAVSAAGYDLSCIECYVKNHKGILSLPPFLSMLGNETLGTLCADTG